MFSQRELIELQEAADLSAPLNSSMLPRWQRKALAAKANAMESQGKTPSSKGSGKTPSGKGGKTPVAVSLPPSASAPRVGECRPVPRIPLSPQPRTVTHARPTPFSFAPRRRPTASSQTGGQ